MAKISDIEIKKFFNMVEKAKEDGESLSKVFEEFARQMGRAKGSVRNFYYNCLKQAEIDPKIKQKYFGDKVFSTNKIIVFDKAESKLLLEKILIGQTFGKSVRRVISEMSQNPQVALRYQNKYRNLIKFDKNAVLKVREEIIKTYGKCYNPYQKERDSKEQLGVLKKEINQLCDRIAFSLKEENQTLKKKLEDVKRENEFLKTMLKSQGENAVLTSAL